jgi:hypothetical protein
MSTQQLMALVVVLALVAIAAYSLTRSRRDRFTSRRAEEICTVLKDKLDQTKGAATFTECKELCSDLDPVVFTDVRASWKSGTLTPDVVKKFV